MNPFNARMAELADALGSGPSVRKDIGVQVPFRAVFLFIKITNYRFFYFGRMWLSPHQAFRGSASGAPLALKCQRLRRPCNPLRNKNSTFTHEDLSVFDLLPQFFCKVQNNQYIHFQLYFVQAAKPWLLKFHLHYSILIFLSSVHILH